MAGDVLPQSDADAKARMEKLVGEFLERMRAIHLFRRAADSLAKKELEDLATCDDFLKNHPDREAELSSYYNFDFRALENGERFFYGLSRFSIEQRHQFALHTKNKQYQWLLAEAFEAFQDFIWKTYALIGSVDHDFWPLEDYGKISLPELSGKEFDWFYKQAKKKKKDIRDIVKLYRKKRLVLADLEQHNNLNRDLRVFLPLIEQLRHFIAHRGGVVVNKDEFAKEVLETEGLYNNGNVGPQVRLILDIPFGRNEYANTITLLEHEDAQTRFELFTECLLAYAHAVSVNLILQ